VVQTLRAQSQTTLFFFLQNEIKRPSNPFPMTPIKVSGKGKGNFNMLPISNQRRSSLLLMPFSPFFTLSLNSGRWWEGVHIF
jgi:hypothetical protein